MAPPWHRTPVGASDIVQRLPAPRTTAVLVSFQTEGTHGQALLAGAHTVQRLGHDERVRIDVVSVPAFSVHAKATELLAWLRTVPQSLEQGRPDAGGT
jgi:predicted metal-dependent RNase